MQIQNFGALGLYYDLTAINWMAQDRTLYTTQSSPAYYAIYADRDQRLQSRGWCPSVCENLQRKHHNSLLDYVDAAAFVNGGDDHQGCSSEACLRNAIDPATYRPQHRSANCVCLRIRPSLQRIGSILDMTYIPVVNISSQGGMSVKPASQVSAYVAFSHVWSDGLGGTTEGGLPSCQAEYLSKCARRLLRDMGLAPVDSGEEETAFWIDSLCVLAERHLRNKAIGMLADTYRDAATVIVLDQSLQGLSRKTRMNEINWNIAASSWMRRLWTYQGSRFAKHLYCHSADGFRNIDELLRMDLRPGESWSAGALYLS